MEEVGVGRQLKGPWNFESSGKENFWTFQIVSAGRPAGRAGARCHSNFVKIAAAKTYWSGAEQECC